VISRSILLASRFESTYTETMSRQHRVNESRTVQVDLDYNGEEFHAEVDLSWDENERGEGWRMEYTSGDFALDLRIESVAIAQVERADALSWEPPQSCYGDDD
jgi:hypothetical protein